MEEGREADGADMAAVLEEEWQRALERENERTQRNDCVRLAHLEIHGAVRDLGLGVV